MPRYGLKVIVPVITDIFNEPIQRAYEPLLHPDFSMDVANTREGPASIETEYDEALAAPPAAKATVEAERQGYGAAIIYCFGNPGLLAARSMVSIPVVGIGEAAELLAMSLGDRYSVIVTVPEAAARHRNRARLLGTDRKLASVRPVNIHVLHLLDDHPRLVAAIEREARDALQRDGADVIVLGCGGMLNVAQHLSHTLGVPVVDPGSAALKLAETLVLLGLSRKPQRVAVPFSTRSDTEP